MNKISKNVLIFVVLLLASASLVSCMSAPKEYEMPEFKLKQESYITSEVKRQEIFDFEQMRLTVYNTVGEQISFVYHESEQCTLLVDQVGANVKAGQVLAYSTSKELDNKKQLAQEDLLLKNLYYDYLVEEFGEDEKRAYDIKLAYLDIKEAEFNVHKIEQEYESLKIISPMDGEIDKISETYENIKDAFGNMSKLYTLTYTYKIDNFILRMNTNKPEVVQALSNLKKDEILTIKDKDGIQYDAKITYMSISNVFNPRVNRWSSSAVFLLELLDETGKDFTEVVKYALYYDAVIRKIEDVIYVDKKLIHSIDDGEPYVYVLENNKKFIRYLVLGNEVVNSTAYVVLEGLEEGDLVISRIIME